MRVVELNNMKSTNLVSQTLLIQSIYYIHTENTKAGSYFGRYVGLETAKYIML